MCVKLSEHPSKREPITVMYPDPTEVNYFSSEQSFCQMSEFVFILAANFTTY